MNPDRLGIEALRALPKVLLHEHLDGSLRVSTLHELLRTRHLPCPAADESQLARWFDDRARAGSLERYLEGFDLTVAAMASVPALERVAFEAAEDARAQGCVLAEFRIAPLLFEDHGLRGDAVVEALLSGLARSALPSGLIVCAMRQLAPDDTLRAVDLALRYWGRGVVGFDLAGPESGYPVSLQAAALARCRDAGLPMTLHAGEADVAERVLEASDHGARRIGHGVHLVEALHDPARHHLIELAIARDLHLEVCPTSNVHTGAVLSIADHPINRLWRAGVSLSYHTDNTLMSRITHSSEARVLLEDTPLGVADLLTMAHEAARHSFLPEARRHAATEAIERAAAVRGLPLQRPVPDAGLASP
jgi:adenosine deaminase